MRIEHLLLRVQKAGIRLWVQDQTQLKFEAPKGALTPDLRDDIAKHKQDIIAFLNMRNAQNTKADFPLGVMDRTHGIPLSFAQQRLWFLYQMEGKSATYNIPACRLLRGKLDIACLVKSLNELVKRHEILRTNFKTTGERAEQVIASSRTLLIPLEDARNASSKEKERLKEKQIEDETACCFDLEKDSLLRLKILRLGEEEYFLTLVLHHIIGDGWSLEILIRELSVIYEAFLNGKTPNLPPLALQYADFALWQRQWEEGGGLESQLAFWKKALAGMPNLLSLPYDKKRPRRQSYNGAIEFFTINPALTQRLESFCKKENASLYMGLCSILSCLIHKYMGHEDIVLGTHTAGRTRKEQEALIGFFINTLPLRTDLSQQPNFREALHRVSKSARDVFSHQDVPFEKLVDIVQPERDMAYAPLVQVMCVLQNMPIAKSTFADIEVETVPLTRDTAKFDLSLLAEQSNDGLLCEFEYCADLFNAETIQRMAGHFTTLVERLLDEPDKPVLDIDLLDQNERDLILNQFAHPIKDTPPFAHSNAVTAFEAQAAQTPDHIALSENGVTLNYRNLNTEANQLAHLFIQQGINTEDVIALSIDNSKDAIIAILATLKAGAAYLPLDPALPQERLDFILKDANVRLHIKGDLSAYRTEMASQSENNPNLVINNKQLAYIIYTSGSTGLPKGVMMEQVGLIDLVSALKDNVYFMHEGPLNVALMASLVFDASVQQIFATLLQGYTLHLCDKETKRDGSALLVFLKDNRIDLSDATPTLLRILIDNGLCEHPSLSLKHMLVGGEALPQSLARRLKATNITLTNVYGPTECCVDVTALTLNNQIFECNTLPIGRPIGQTRAYILDKVGKPVPIGVDGHLHISGAGLFRGYVNQANRTAKALLPNPFKSADDNPVFAFMYPTGDICHWLPDGTIAYVGRNDDQVKIRGFRIELGDIEANLANHPDISQACALAQQNADGIHELHAYLESAQDIAIEALHSYLKERLPDYIIPSFFYRLDKLPLNKSGKVDRTALKQHGTSNRLASDKKQVVVAQTAEEHALVAVLADVLKTPHISMTDNFFYLGGDSIKALQIVARLNQQKYRLDIRAIFENSVIQKMAANMVPHQDDRAEETPLTKGDEIPMTAIQRWYFDTYPDQRHHFNQSVLLSTNQNLDELLLQRALKAVFSNHDAFALKFIKHDTGYVQIYDQVDFGFHCFIALNDKALQQFTKDLQRLVDPTKCPVQVGWIRTKQENHLFIAAHHLIIDAVSWRTLFEEFEATYRQLEKGEEVQLTKPDVSFALWAKTVNNFAHNQATADLAYWQKIDATPATDLPVDCQADNCTHGDCESIQAHLSKQETALLLGEVHETYNTRIDDFLLGALARVLSARTQNTPCRILLESHGREPLPGLPNGIGANVGWLTSMYPVLLHATEQENDAHLLMRTKEMLRAIPNKGMTYGILRHLSKNAPLFADYPQISFNYLGQFDDGEDESLFKLSTQETSPNIAPRAPQPFRLEIIGMVSKGRLEIHMGYSSKHFAQETVQNLLFDYVTCLKQLINHAGKQEVRSLTPSDVDWPDVDQDTLDQLITDLGHYAFASENQLLENHP